MVSIILLATLKVLLYYGITVYGENRNIDFANRQYVVHFLSTRWWDEYESAKIMTRLGTLGNQNFFCWGGFTKGVGGGQEPSKTILHLFNQRKNKILKGLGFKRQQTRFGMSIGLGIKRSERYLIRVICLSAILHTKSTWNNFSVNIYRPFYWIFSHFSQS